MAAVPDLLRCLSGLSGIRRCRAGPFFGRDSLHAAPKVGSFAGWSHLPATVSTTKSQKIWWMCQWTGLVRQALYEYMSLLIINKWDLIVMSRCIMRTGRKRRL
jgi:hypothetical protein